MSTNERLSYSRYYLYTKCRKAYEYQYIQKLTPAAGTVPPEAWIKRGRGILIHGACEAGLAGRPLADGINEQIVELEFPPRGGPGRPDLAATARTIAAECEQVAQDLLDWLPANDFEPLVVNGKLGLELELSCPVTGWKDFMGYADLVVRHKPTGRVFVGDYKSTERFKSPESEVFRVQMILYAYALRQMGVKVDGALIVQLKPELPKGKPRKVRIDEGGIDAPRESADGRFQLTPTRYSDTYVDNVWSNFDRVAAEMAQFEASRSSYIQMSDFSCGFCDYSALCSAELNDMDADWVRKNKFTQRSYTKRSTQLNVVL
jgi:hypothetical protein